MYSGGAYEIMVSFSWAVPWDSRISIISCSASAPRLVRMPNIGKIIVAVIMFSN